MGNQQATEASSQFNLGWIIGMIEGEGLIGLYKNKSGNNKTYYLRPVIKIYNTEISLIAKCHEILLELGIPHHIYEGKPRLKATNKEYKTLYSLYIQGIKRCDKALKVLRPELFTGQKGKNLKLIQEYIDIRLATPMTKSNKNRQPSETEIKIAEQVRLNNLRGKDARSLNDYTLSVAN